jgi:hypothetical protein
LAKITLGFGTKVGLYGNIPRTGGQDRAFIDPQLSQAKSGVYSLVDRTVVQVEKAVGVPSRVIPACEDRASGYDLHLLGCAIQGSRNNALKASGQLHEQFSCSSVGNP